MSINGNHDFAAEKASFADKEDYDDVWMACVIQWRRVLKMLSLPDLVATLEEARKISADLGDIRMRTTLLYGPTGDREMIDMVLQWQERLEAYEFAVRNEMEERALMPHLYADEPALFLKTLAMKDERADRVHKVNLPFLRQQRANERAQWEAERGDWEAAEHADEDHGVT